ncbi:MAG: tetratricopeptide repeat protein [Candidatus Zixiibacteriota bacterium]|nr:MAG: tetratricopeptide repeat protein [candidate division Zixibacteria bacterium]
MKKRRSKSGTKLQPASSVSDRMFEYLLLLVLLLSVLSHLLAVYRGTPFLWGIHLLHFFPRWLGWVLTLATASLFIPPVNRLALRFLETTFRALSRLISKIPKYPAFIAAGIVSIPFFWSLRTKFFLLGDGYFKLDTLTAGAITPTEPLDGIIHHQFYLLLTTLFPNADPSLSYTIPSVVCGGAFIFLILVLADLLGKTSFGKVLIFSALVTLGSIELFFGYVESYTTLLVALTLFILFSVLFLQGRLSIVFSFLALALSISLHVSAIALMPAFLYLIIWKWQAQGRKSLDVSTVLCIVACSGIVFLAVWKVFLMPGETNRLGQFVPLVATPKSSFTMFCGAHLGEFANQLFLISPAGTILFLFFLFYTIKLGSFKRPFLNFLLISSLSGLFLIFVYNSRWGNADWDLRAFPSVFLTLFGILLFMEWGGRWSRFKNYGLIVIAVSLFHTVPWILVNASEQKSLDRYVLTGTEDRHINMSKGGGIWAVARVLERAGFTQKAEEVYKEGIRRNPDSIASYSLLGNNLYFQRKWDQAIFYLEKALMLDPQSREVQFTLGHIYTKKQDFQKAMSYLEKVKDVYERDSAFVMTLSETYLRTHRWKDAENTLQTFLANDPESATARGLLGVSLFMQNDLSGAREEWERALELNPDEPNAKTGLEKLGRNDER